MQIHKDAYRFVEDIKAKELSDLKKDLNTEDDPEKIKQIKYLIQRIENQNRERKKVEGMKQSEKEQKKRNRELIKEGKAPEFVSKEEKKNMKDTENKMKDVVEKNCIKCEKCENCDQCDFLQNHASCRICRIRFYATLKNLEKKDAELKEKLADQKKREEWYRK